MNIYILQNYLLLTYDHNTIYKWISKNFPRDQKFMKLQSLELNKNIGHLDEICKKSSMVEKIIGRLVICGWVDFQHVLINVRLNEQNSSIGFNKFRIILEQDQNKRG